jgi:hypothetical protein
MLSVLRPQTAAERLNLSRTLAACTFLFLLRSQRGDSGNGKSATAAPSAKSPAMTNGQRQPSTPKGCSGVNQRIKKTGAGAARNEIAQTQSMYRPRYLAGAIPLR